MLALDPNSLVPALRRASVNAKDLSQTIAIADAGTMVRLGVVPRTSIWPDWDKGDTPGQNHNSSYSIAGDLLKVASHRGFDPARAIDLMAPKNWVYRELQRGYINSRNLVVSNAQVPQLPNPSSTGAARPGQPYAYAPVLAEILATRGFLQMAPEERRSLTSVTPALADAIKKFQRSYGLDADGIVGSGTWRYLSGNPGDVYKQTVINLHRARLLPDTFGKRYLIVNLPSAELYGFENIDDSILSMRIVHGKNSNKDLHTPIFRDVLREVVFAPYWNVPESISMKEIYPKLIDDPTYLTRKRYEIVNNFRSDATVYELNEETLASIGKGKLFLRQKPMSSNALGKVKFLLPNQFHVYLHDTPSKHYFSASDRAQSHGCIRLADPPKMAGWALGSQGWNQEKIKKAMNGDVRVAQAVQDPINVYITYFTIFPRKTGTSAGQFVLAPARDVYKLDQKDAQTLANAIPWLGTSG